MEAFIAGAVVGLISVFGGLKLRLRQEDEILNARLGHVERLISDNGIKASSPETLDERFSRLERLLVQNSDAIKELTAQEDQLKSHVDAQIKKATENLISRDEVQQAFARVAQIEAQRINAERQTQSEVAQQQLRAQQVFGTMPMPPDMNVAINNQLAALNERLQQIGATIP